MSEQKDNSENKWTPKYGNRHSCYSCGTKFYDMGKDAVVCPRCSSNQADMPVDEIKKPATKAKKKKAKVEEPPADNNIIEIDSDTVILPDLDELDMEDDDFSVIDDDEEE